VLCGPTRQQDKDAKAVCADLPSESRRANSATTPPSFLNINPRGFFGQSVWGAAGGFFHHRPVLAVPISPPEIPRFPKVYPAGDRRTGEETGTEKAQRSTKKHKTTNYSLLLVLLCPFLWPTSSYWAAKAGKNWSLAESLGLALRTCPSFANRGRSGSSEMTILDNTNPIT
jgi:hypothetical protein